MDLEKKQGTGPAAVQSYVEAGNGVAIIKRVVLRQLQNTFTGIISHGLDQLWTPGSAPGHCLLGNVS